jgi:hypothetical protein
LTVKTVVIYFLQHGSEFFDGTIEKRMALADPSDTP